MDSQVRVSEGEGERPRSEISHRFRANGQTLTAQEMQGLMDRADSDKLKKAQGRLAQAAEPEMQPEGKS